MVTIEETEEMLNEIAKEIPSELFRELNGGIVLLPEAKLHERHRRNDLYILGEYHSGKTMGRYIAIYYGSFKRIHGHLSKERYKEKLKKTLKHEFLHHVESLAGEKGLIIKDREFLRDYLDRG